jgi:hypothetical protein
MSGIKKNHAICEYENHRKYPTAAADEKVSSAGGKLSSPRQFRGPRYGPVQIDQNNITVAANIAANIYASE